MIGTEFIATAIWGVLKPFLPYFIALIAALGWGYSQRRAGAASERNAQKAKDADAYEQHLKDLAAAATARPTGGVSSDPNNRDAR